MDFRLLGPLAVAENDLPVPLGGSRARALLAVLLVHRNNVVPLDRIVDASYSAGEAHVTTARATR